jgi:hypothetical protein
MFNIASLLNSNGVFDKVKYGEALVDTKELLGETLPYTLVSNIIKDKPTVIFNDHFLETFRQAMTTGCMTRMSHEEENLLYAFIEYQDILYKYIEVFDEVDMRFDAVKITDFINENNLVDTLIEGTVSTGMSKIFKWLSDIEDDIKNFANQDKEYQELIHNYVEAYIYKSMLSTDLHIIHQLEIWLNDELACRPHPELNECYDATHTWNSCNG